jgi:TetR/AcrR family transcriptional regulator, transcriptional repressor for nem operon
MKVSKQEADANRERIVEVASRLFREKGFNGIGVADLMKTAGMTHGGFYGHFNSKEHLAEEACGRAVARACERWSEIAKNSEMDAFGAVVKNYLSQDRLASTGSGCVFAALGSDAARQGEAVRAVFTAGFERLVGILTGLVPGRGKRGKRKVSIVALSEMVGAMVLARCVADPELAREILKTVGADLASKR